MSSNNKTSFLVSSQVPSFIRNDDGNFTAFLEAYYEFLEQSGNVLDRSKNLASYTNVDTSVDAFIEHLYSSFMPGIPDETSADKTFLLKHIKDFYRARGSEKSYRFLMRILFGKEINLYYPKTDILRASDGKWYVEKALKFGEIILDGEATDGASVYQKFTGTEIRGLTSNATALVERSIAYYSAGTKVYELKLSSQSKDFSSSETIEAKYDEDGFEHTLRANVFGGIISYVSVEESGLGYSVGDKPTIVSNTGIDGEIMVTSVSTGNVSSLIVIEGGSGYHQDDLIYFIGVGTGANGNVSTVDSSGFYHPNSYNICMSTIGFEANTPIGNALYSNLNSMISDPANNWIENVFSYLVYSNTGPIETAAVTSPGSNYFAIPATTIAANTRVVSMGILGRMEIIDGGHNYTIGDKIEFPGPGTGGYANISNVDANGSITEVHFEGVFGYPVGGMGYDQANLPTGNIRTSTGSNGNVIVTSILGQGANIRSVTTSIGAIQELKVIKQGRGYDANTVLDFSGIGDGNASASVLTIDGIFEYPGRWLNDDGIISSYNFLQDRDYYQNFSYVLKVRKSIEYYRSYLKKLLHPAGTKLFGEYSVDLSNEGTTTMDFSYDSSLLKVTVTT